MQWIFVKPSIGVRSNLNVHIPLVRSRLYLSKK
uniref:Uncharacterized protein n=1 Tax=Rhizophora mucronata TaxID=61149 RepID=A0A2P2N7M0_RHIMU